MTEWKLLFAVVIEIHFSTQTRPKMNLEAVCEPMNRTSFSNLLLLIKIVLLQALSRNLHTAHRWKEPWLSNKWKVL